MQNYKIDTVNAMIKTRILTGIDKKDVWKRNFAELNFKTLDYKIKKASLFKHL